MPLVTSELFGIVRLAVVAVTWLVAVASGAKNSSSRMVPPSIVCMVGGKGLMAI